MNTEEKEANGRCIKSEVKLLLNCNHKNIIKSYGFFEEPGHQISFLMEYYPKGNLESFIIKNKNNLNFESLFRNLFE